MKDCLKLIHLHIGSQVTKIRRIKTALREASQFYVQLHVMGFNDNTCPPTTSYIVYNVLNCPKEALITPVNEHWTSEDTEYRCV